MSDVQKRLESITARNGYAVFPRQVVVLESADGVAEQPERTVAIVETTQGCDVFVCVTSPGGETTEAALRQNIDHVLAGLDTRWLDDHCEVTESKLPELDDPWPAKGVRVGEPELTQTDNPNEDEADDATA